MPPPISFTFRPTGVGRARIGRLQTPHGAVDTPQFMPVGTQGTVKSLTPGDLRAAGTQILLGNTYHLSLRPGHERIARLGGLHRFMGWDGAILTDSGGFQVFSLAERRQVDEDGVTFASHVDGSPHRLTPESAITIQEALGSDIAMVLDQLIGPDRPRAEVEEATERTHRWAARCLAARSRADQALFGIVQGGVHRELRAASARTIAGMAFDGIAVGGLSVGESKAEMAAALDAVAEALGDDPRPRYLMGVGSPVDFFTGVQRGIDLFDCVLPTRVARNGQLWTSEGRLNLRNARFLDDPGPLDPACACEACRRHSRAYLAHLFRAEELLAYRLASVHNVTYTLDLMRRIRSALDDGSFASLRDVVAAQYGSIGAARDKPPISGR
ncbi:MAG TPA: tRNA guanosine(34) transglycosylase Tgt [candidate division Zixibacteria bacterium]|nr:tRNA guanosine(34) transglycosylase Tgt [candidate division Zixibacteria bacterium]